MIKDFGLLLIKARKSAGYTQEQASELLDISVRTLAKYEANQIKPTIDKMNDIVEIYGNEYIGYQYLLTFRLGQKLFAPIENKSFSAGTQAYILLRFMKKCTRKDRNMEELYVFGTGNAQATHCYNTCFAIKDGDEFFYGRCRRR